MNEHAMLYVWGDTHHDYSGSIATCRSRPAVIILDPNISSKHYDCHAESIRQSVVKVNAISNILEVIQLTHTHT